LGLSLAIRRLDRGDAAAILAHLCALDRDDRIARFGAPVGETSLRDYVARLPRSGACLFGATGSSGVLIGLAHLGPPDTGTEFGLSVAAGHRRQGVATALLGEAARTARALGVAQLVCLHGHPAVLRAAAHWALPVHRAVVPPRALIGLQHCTVTGSG
jgi:GNAT superfamily N-acetyltransferase